MSDEYKDRYINIALLKTPPRYYRIQDTTVSSLTELKQRVPDQTELRISQIRIVDRLLKLP